MSVLVFMFPLDFGSLCLAVFSPAINAYYTGWCGDKVWGGGALCNIQLHLSALVGPSHLGCGITLVVQLILPPFPTSYLGCSQRSSLKT